MGDPGGFTKDSVRARWTDRTIAPLDRANPFAGVQTATVADAIDVWGIRREPAQAPRGAACDAPSAPIWPAACAAGASSGASAAAASHAPAPPSGQPLPALCPRQPRWAALPRPRRAHRPSPVG